MQNTSRYYQIRDEILLEYIYTDINNPELFNSETNNIFILNNQKNNQNYLFSEDKNEDIFLNVRDLSSVEIDQEISQFGYLDIDKPFLLNDQLDELTNSNNLKVDFINNYDIAYDRFKIHFASGYDFEGNDGFIFELQVFDKFNNPHNLSSLTYRRSDSFAKINPRPFLIGGTEYSTFIEVLIPSTYFLISEINSNPNDLDKLNFKLTNNIGINNSTNINFKVSTINNTVENNAQVFFNTLDKVNFSIPIQDEFSGLVASITDADDGDYFILEAKFDNKSIQDYIISLNTQPNSNWVLLHNLYLIEQIGSELIETSSESWIQDSNFEDVRLWRPVIKNLNSVSYTIDYTIRLFNRLTNEQIIKRATETFLDPTRYAKSLKRINLGTVPIIDEIYNLVQGNEIKMEGFKGSSINSVQYVPNFFDKSEIIISNINTFSTNDTDISTQDTLQNENQNLYKQGELTISINPFDNYFKFIILRNLNNDLKFLNLTQLGNLKLAFTDNNQSEISFNSIISESVNPDSGEVVFYIPSSIAKEIQKFTNKQFYIIIETDNGNENLIYSGTIENESDRINDNGLNFIQNLQTSIDVRNSTIDSLNENLQSRNNEIERLQALLAVKDEEIQFLKNPNTTIQKTSPAKINLEQLQNNQSNIKIIANESEELRKIETRRKGNLLKQTNLNLNK